VEIGVERIEGRRLATEAEMSVRPYQTHARAIGGEPVVEPAVRVAQKAIGE
jgi:hypothetical protein